MHRAATALVPRVERSQQLNDLRASDLTDAYAIRTHPQGLPDEIAHRDHACTLDIRGSSLHSDHVTASWFEFGRVFDKDESLVVTDA
jgi:hypothetical protein